MSGGRSGTWLVVARGSTQRRGGGSRIEEQPQRADEGDEQTDTQTAGREAHSASNFPRNWRAGSGLLELTLGWADRMDSHHTSLLLLGYLSSSARFIMWSQGRNLDGLSLAEGTREAFKVKMECTSNAYLCG